MNNDPTLSPIFGIISENRDYVTHTLTWNHEILYGVWINTQATEDDPTLELIFLIFTRDNYFHFIDGGIPTNLITVFSKYGGLRRSLIKTSMPWFFVSSKDLNPNKIIKLIDDHIQRKILVLKNQEKI